ncbi:hypothetical protein NUM3379_10040 [Kineococcus sp. NUM-3379]
MDVTALGPGLPTAAAGALLAHLLLAEPLLGRRSHRRLTAALARGETGARTRFYRTWTLWGWAVAVVALAVCLLGGLAPAQLGLRAPTGAAGDAGGLTGFLVGALAATTVVTLVLRRSGGPRVPGGSAIAALLPRTGRERAGFAGLSVTAGVGEEVVYRAFLPAAVVTLVPGLHGWALVAVCAATFGAAHAYQGWGGVLSTGLFGAAMLVLYLETGSLLLPVLVHTLVDLRALLLLPPEEERAPEHGPAAVPAA